MNYSFYRQVYRILSLLLLAITVGVGHPAWTHARDITIAMPLLPSLVDLGDDGKLQGRFIDLIAAMDDVYPEGRIIPLILPFMRAKDSVGKKADVLFPYAWNERLPKRTMSFQYSNAFIYEAKFYLYCHKDMQLTPEQARSGSYILETDIAHVDLFPFVQSGTISLKSSILKLEHRRLDGFIFAALSMDKTFKDMETEGWTGRKDIVAIPFETFRASFVLPPDSRGDALDSILTRLVDKVRASGKLREILKPIIEYYESIP